MQPLIISFYTNDWEYPAHAARLKKECDDLNLECYIEERPTTTDYIKNTAIKPWFIKETIEKFKRPVVWVDVDGTVLKPIKIAHPTVDFAACTYKYPKLSRDWAVGIMFFNYTNQSLTLLDCWCKNTQRLKAGTDEAEFDLAWKAMKDKVKSYTLPPEYHFIAWRDSLEIPSNTVYLNRLSKSPDKMRRKQKNGNIKEI